MYLVDDTLVISPSDLNNFVECRHLTQLDLAYANGERTHEPTSSREGELLARKGDEHEAAYLASLRAEGREVVEIQDPADRSLKALAIAASETEDAMRAGTEVIYQATFFDPPFRGHTDFLFSVDRPSELGDHSYEVADAKLARRTKPYFIFQLCFYSEMVQAMQGGPPPERIHVILGTGEQRSYRLAEFAAYFRHIRAELLADLNGSAPDTYPEPVAHCAICRWKDRCDAQREADDHLSLVANINRIHVERLRAAGTETLAGLARLDENAVVPRVREEILERLRSQASLQLRARETGELALELLNSEAGRGFHRLPRPSAGDVFFDMEGDPFFEDGLEYLFGFVTADAGEPEFTALWGRDRAEEGQALERFVDYVTERRERFPDLHVYHYAHYEVTALKRLAGMHGTREAELDQLLRDEVFVDLYKVVREALRISQPSYSLKKVEAFYMDQRDTAVTDGNDSVIEFERWLEERDESILERIADYNRDDCLSTLRLRDWLLERRAEAEQLGEIPWFSRDASAPGEEATKQAGEIAELRSGLLAGLPDELDEASDDERARALLGDLLEYHHREARPVWWAFFDRVDRPPHELIDDADCLGGLTDAGESPRPDRRSLVHAMVVPAQETKVKAGASLCDPARTRPEVTVVDIDMESGRLDLKRGPGHAGAPLPRSLIPSGPYDTRQQRGALRRLAASVIEHGINGAGPYRAARDLLLSRAPRVRGHAYGEPLYEGSASVESLLNVVERLDNGSLIVQGPPGAGKTWSAARVIASLLAAGRRVGVTSTSHRAIHNLLSEIDSVADERGIGFRGLKKCSADKPESVYESKRIESVDDNSALVDAAVPLTAGTAWHYCREEVDGTLDYLFVDEAGQISLADALALGTAARNIVLLGDPQQLPQVAQGRHPAGAAVSVLEHILGDRQTIPCEEGVFLDRTYRLHPDVCAFVSELMYDDRLESAEGCGAQRILGDGELSGTGLRWIPVEHSGNSQESPEEVERVAGLVDELVGGRYVDADGNEHPIALDDILVVSPFNAQVRYLIDGLPDGARIGTVDKFQGQEAQAVIFSMATSSGEEIPRGLEFLFSRNRLNVAVSRARCVAAVAASPKLLDVRCATVNQMRLVNALCRVAEIGATTRSPSTQIS